MRLSPTVLSILAGTLAGAALSGCGGAAQRTEPTTPRNASVVSVRPATASTVSTRLPRTNGPPLRMEDIEIVACGRG